MREREESNRQTDRVSEKGTQSCLRKKRVGNKSSNILIQDERRLQKWHLGEMKANKLAKVITEMNDRRERLSEINKKCCGLHRMDNRNRKRVEKGALSHDFDGKFTYI